jgi:hypothetical protein
MNSIPKLVVFWIVIGGFVLTAISVSAQNSLTRFSQQVPPHAVVGSTPDRSAAYHSLTPDQLRALSLFVQPYLQNALQQAMAQHQSSINGQDLIVHSSVVDQIIRHGLSRSLTLQNPLIVTNGSTSFTVPLYPSTGIALPANSATGQVTGDDLDHDGLPDNFENQLADEFTPFYFVSAGEPDSFATFQNGVPEQVAQLFGPNPLSYFRVKPLGFVTNSAGVEYGVIQINYLTLWDFDNGLAVSDTCDEMMGVAGGILGLDLIHLVSVLTGHKLDDEHSAALLVAPSMSGTFNLDPSQYLAIDYYTAAHEGTFFDLSSYVDPSVPVPANNHLKLALSLNKHSTYAGNPDLLPLFPVEIIEIYYDTIFELWADGLIDDLQFAALQFIGDTVFFGCVVEHFSDQGGAFASPRINVGEPVAGSILNSAGFILDRDHVHPKLTEAIWLVGTPPIIVTTTPAASFLDGAQSQQFRASVLNDPNNNQGVTWSLDVETGSITQAGLYTAPPVVSNAQTVTITACSTSAPTRCGSSLAFLNPIAVTVSPKVAVLLPNQAQQFSATVVHTGATAVTWSLSPQVGTISSSGVYTAPTAIASQQTISVIACSVVDSTKCDTAVVTLLPPPAGPIVIVNTNDPQQCQGIDLSLQRQTIYAGQQVNLRACIPSLQAWQTVETARWTINGNVVLSYSASTPNATLRTFNPPDDCVDQINVGSVGAPPHSCTVDPFYWVCPIVNPAVCTYPGTVTAVFEYTLNSGNGSSNTVTYNVLGPGNTSVPITVNPDGGTATVQITSDQNGLSIAPTGITVVSSDSSNRTSVGVVLMASAQLPADPKTGRTVGSFSWARVLNNPTTISFVQGSSSDSQIVASQGPGAFSCSLVDPLDSHPEALTYPASTVAQKNVPSDLLLILDGAGLQPHEGEGGFSRLETAYLFWEPDPVGNCTSCTIPIPLGAVTYHFSGAATNTLDPIQGTQGWTMNASCGTGPGTFSLVPGTAFPIWTAKSAVQNCAPIQ